MEFSPCRWFGRKRLYRNGGFAASVAMTLAGLILLAATLATGQAVTPLYGRKTAPEKGPRALGLVQLSTKGKARIIPIAIMMDGKFYDAGAYKADPVPMALDFGIIYEGFRAGVSQGVFTITQPGQLNHEWIAEGKWLPAGAVDPQKKKKYAAPVIADEGKDDRPVLHRRVAKTDSDSGADGKSADAKNSDSDKNKDQDKNNDKDKDQQKTATAPASTTGGAPPAAAPASSTAAGTADAAKAAAASPAPTRASADSTDETIADPNRPRLRRGKPEPSEQHEPFTTFAPLTEMAATSGSSGPSAGKAVAGAKDAGAALAQVTVIPAISDAGGPDPRPYTYDLKPAEEAIYRNKMFELAAAQLRAQAAAASKQSATASKPAAKRATGKAADKDAKPEFDNVSLRIFDLSSSNEPVLVLSAKTRPAGAESSAEPKEITLIARTNLEGELRKLFFSETDSRHLDVAPRMELIDAVDADGDGRGELLFRRTFDDGSAYAIYRISADRLWPLFEGTH
jgi:hypothetical protein